VRVEIQYEGESLAVESSEPITINEVLKRLEIPPSTVLAVQGQTILPHTSLIKDDATLELMIVSSGG
tara:strand:- start:1433 stop:1633 length:201 start_codon:yes stop_codon:yes gene_type:complete